MEFHEYNIIPYVITNFNGVKFKKTIPGYTILCPKLDLKGWLGPQIILAV
jgi:hypothetical protein